MNTLIFQLITSQVIVALIILAVFTVAAGITLILSKYPKVYHVYVGLIIGMFATIVWVNNSSIPGIIIASGIYALMVAYLIIMLNPKSRISIWLNKIAIKINLKTLNWTLQLKSWNPSLLSIVLVLSLGAVFHFLLFWVFYHVLQFYALGSILALIGLTLLFIGLILQYKRFETKDKLRSFLLLVAFLTYFMRVPLLFLRILILIFHFDNIF